MDARSPKDFDVIADITGQPVERLNVR